MVAERVRAQHSIGHFVAGVAMLLLGVVGLVYSWDALGLVARGCLPFALCAVGLVMVGAGVRAVREDRELPASLKTLTPIVALVACVLLAAAAAANVSVDLPHEWTPSNIVGYVALGFVSGIVGGMLGLGGGVVHLSGLTLLFGFPFVFARGATLITNVFINAAAAFRYGRRRLMLWSVVVLLLPTSLIGVLGGSLVQAGFDEGVMRKVFSAFVVLITIGIIVDTFNSQVRANQAVLEGAAVRHGLTGAFAGLISGVLGISGGVIAVPGQTLSTGVPLRQAIANSTLITAASSALGVIILFTPVAGGETRNLSEMAVVAALFVPGNLIGGYFGALWMERLPVMIVRGFFVMALAIIAIRAWGFPL